MSVDSIERIISSGIIPLELEYYSINTLANESSNQVGFRTIVRINSPELGALYPEQYRNVLNRTSQCIKLSNWSFLKLINDADKILDEYPENILLTIYFPARMILKSDLEKLLESVPEDKQYILPHLVIEFSSDILFISSPQLIKKLTDLKEKYGIKLLMSEFGYEYCPILKLADLPFDYIILDKTISTHQALSSVNVQSVIQLIKNYSMSCILENTGKRNILETAYNCGCTYYCSNRKTNPAGAK